MPKANTLQDFIAHKKEKSLILRVSFVHDYELTDIPEIIIPDKVIAYARKISPLLDQENRGQKTKDGGTFKNIKGTVGQWAVHKHLLDKGWKHTYSKPYVSEQYGDKYDIIFDDEVWDVKCRDWWTQDYFYNIRLLMGVHEKKAFDEGKRCDQYIFTTVTKDYKKAYILGGIGGYDLWDRLADLTEKEHQHMRYPTQGKIYSRQLLPIRYVITHTKPY